ncbi:hypothetical protein PTKIN_Ptkin14bG0089700 [Pterospermum kingtungense]
MAAAAATTTPTPTTTTTCSITNQIASTLKYQKSHDWNGSLGADTSYPTEVPSGSTVTFQHVGNQNGSKGSVLYRFQNSEGVAYDLVLGWLNPPDSTNKVFDLIDQVIEYPYDDTEGRWSQVDGFMTDGESQGKDSNGGCNTVAEIGDGNFPTFSATVATAE